MAEGLLPWQIHPGLTEERLKFVARLISTIRADTVALHDPDGGDGAWSLGCRAYERTCFGIKKAAENAEHSDWLSMVDQRGLHFVFSVGGVPFRFYKTDDPEENVAPRTLRRFFPELRAQQLAFFDASEVPASDLFFRLAVETEADGRAAGITFVQVDGAGTIYAAWPIPLDGAGAEPLSTRRVGVTLPPPQVGPARVADAENANA